MKGTIFCFAVMLGIASSVPSFWDEDFTSKESSEDGKKIGQIETSCPCGWTNKGRIVGGEETKPNEFPLMAGLVYVPEDNLFCGASIITVHHALTAAHCTASDYYRGKPIHLVVGKHNLNAKEEEKPDAVLYPIDKTLEHEDYNDMTLANDIALVIVNRIIEFSQKVGPVCLPDRAMDLFDEHVKVLGWGRTTDNGKKSSVLMKVNLKVTSMQKCFDTYRMEVGSPKAKNVICTYRTNKDSCEGDSGGPVLWLDPETNRFTLVGLVSYGKMCGGDSPARNTNVGHFLPWIREKIATSGFPEKTCSKLNRYFKIH